jgi:hypothetical protein
VDVADASFLLRAFVTTVLGGDVNLVVTGLFAVAAGLGAGGPGVPGVHAVDAARVSVAVLFDVDWVTWLAAVLGNSDNSTAKESQFPLS